MLSVNEEAQRGQRRSQFGGLTAGCRQEGVVLQLLEGLQREGKKPFTHTDTCSSLLGHTLRSRRKNCITVWTSRSDVLYRRLAFTQLLLSDKSLHIQLKYMQSV